MTKEIKNGLKEQALSYIFEQIKSGSKQRVIDNIKKVQNQVEKRKSQIGSSLDSAGVNFARCFDNLKTGVLNIDNALGAVGDVRSLVRENEGLEIIENVLQEVLSEATKTNESNDSEVIVEGLVKVLKDKMTAED
jgi:hypothetical protein